MAETTNPNTEITAPGQYLLTFDVPAATWNTDVARWLSDQASMRAGAINYLNPSKWELLGTTVEPGKRRFIALVRVSGTPLALIVAGLIQLVFWITAGYVTLQFVKATGPSFGKAVEAIGAGVGNIGEGIGAIGKGTGTGLQFTGTGLGVGLAVAGVGISVLLVAALQSQAKRR